VSNGRRGCVAARGAGAAAGDAGYWPPEKRGREWRYADNQRDLLPELASDLVRREIAAIVANSAAARVAKTVTTTVPIVFVSGEDPVRSGLVDSLSRPGGNITVPSI
jgi:putative ABC transport system substrate-binding protein